MYLANRGLKVANVPLVPGVDPPPELFAAAKRTLELRGDEATGWSMAWKINFWARLHDGDRAWKGFDWEAMKRLHDKGLIENPVNRNKSVMLTEAGGNLP